LRTGTDQILRELRRLRDDVRALHAALVPEVEPTAQERRAIREGRREIREGRYVEWSELRRELRR
jgi:hypothetical protein